MFQFPGFALKILCIQILSTWLRTLLITEVIIMNFQVGCPIQKFMDQSLFSAPHDLSQSITSFIASYCQGIHQTPFSRLIWSRKRKTVKSIAIAQLVTKGNLSSEPKSILSRSSPRSHTSDVGRTRVEDEELLVQLALNRVSVLDLDNSVRFSRDIQSRARKHPKSNLFRRRPNWDQSAYLRWSNSVVDWFLSKRCQSNRSCDVRLDG